MKEINLKSATDKDFQQLENKCIRAIKTDGSNSEITDAALYSISKIVGLEELDLEWAVNITDVGLGYLHALPSLKYLDLSFCSNLSRGALDKLQSAINGLQIES